MVPCFIFEVLGLVNVSGFEVSIDGVCGFLGEYYLSIFLIAFSFFY